MSTQTTTITTPGSTTYTADAHLLNGSVQATVEGSAGASGTPSGLSAAGGKGSKVTGTVTVAPSATLTVHVGDQSTHGHHAGAAGASGGGVTAGHGGGSSAVLSGATVMIEAGGGGGAGMGGVGSSGGAGGAGGQPNGSGGGGQTLTGSTAGGGGNANGNGGSAGTGSSNGTAGSNQAAGVGGAGGVGGASNDGGPGGGGGGGSTGGGGGGGGGWSTSAGTGSGGGGGGGGKSTADVSVGSVVYSNGANTGLGSVVLVATVADVPLAPTLTSPASGASLDTNAAGVTFDWSDNPGTDSGSQNAYALRISTDGGAYQYWNATSVALQGSIVWNATSNQFSTIPAAKLADGHTYTWSVATQESHYNLQGPFASDSAVIATAQPTATVTAPSGTIGNPSPTVTWTEVLGGGLSQTAFRVVIYTAAVTGQPGFSPGVTTPTVDSGVVSSAALLWAVPTVLAQGNWVAYVQITETGPLTSAWASSAFTLAYTGPSAPAVTATPGADGGTGAPTVSVLIDGTGCFTPGGVTLTVPTASLSRSTDSGTTWTAVRAGTNVAVPLSTHQVTVVDYEAPFGVTVTYSATLGATTDTPAGALVTSAPTTATAVLASGQWWMTDPLDTTTALALHKLASVGVLTAVASPVSFQRTNSEQMGVFYAFGRPNAIVQRGTKKAPVFALNCWLAGYSEKVTFEALVGDDAGQRSATLLLRSDMGDAWYVAIGPDIPLSVLRSTQRTTNPDWVVSGAVCTVTDPP